MLIRLVNSTSNNIDMRLWTSQGDSVFRQDSSVLRVSSVIDIVTGWREISLYSTRFLFLFVNYFSLVRCIGPQLLSDSATISAYTTYSNTTNVW